MTTTLADVMPATAAQQQAGNVSLAAMATPFAAAASAPLSETIDDMTLHILGPFAPNLNRQIWLMLNATAVASGTAQILRSIDGGSTKVGLTAGGQPWATYTFAGVIGAIVNEPFQTETSALATYYLSIQLTAGTVVADVHQ